MALKLTRHRSEACYARIIRRAFAAFCEAARYVKPRVSLPVSPPSIVRAGLELLLNLLFALGREAQ